MFIEGRRTRTRRAADRLPLCGYSEGDWYFLFCYLYKKYTGQENIYKNTKTQILYIQDIYKSVFYIREWSAREFAIFLEYFIQVAIKKGLFPSLAMLSDGNINSIVDKFSKERESIKEVDFYERLIYVKFYPLTINQRDLIAIFDEISESKIIFNYGIVCFQKYLQVKNNISFFESINLMKEKLKHLYIGLGNNKEDRKRFLEGMVRNTILWEPYSNSEMRKTVGENKIVMDWRKEISGIIKNNKMDLNLWWRKKEETYGEAIIGAIKDLFVLGGKK